jgi:hypothetical protein
MLAWLGLAVVHLLSLRWGAMFGITAGRHAILRRDRPVKFWIAWLILAWPLLILPTIVAAGLFTSEGGQ